MYVQQNIFNLSFLSSTFNLRKNEKRRDFLTNYWKIFLSKIFLCISLPSPGRSELSKRTIPRSSVTNEPYPYRSSLRKLSKALEERSNRSISLREGSQWRSEDNLSATKSRRLALEDPSPSSSLSGRVSTDPTKIYRRIMDLDQWLLSQFPRGLMIPFILEDFFEAKGKQQVLFTRIPSSCPPPLFSFAIVDRQYSAGRALSLATFRPLRGWPAAFFFVRPTIRRNEEEDRFHRDLHRVLKRHGGFSCRERNSFERSSRVASIFEGGSRLVFKRIEEGTGGWAREIARMMAKNNSQRSFSPFQEHEWSSILLKFVLPNEEECI